jgi:threonine dehydrogenase-like Zn-dependent dehydrogenase
MKAIILTPRQADSARLADVPAPEMTNDQVLVRMIRAGICGTDAELNGGAFGEAPAHSEYLILGHENFGQIERVGTRTSRFQKGDYVVATVRRGCGCINCEAGESDMCLVDKFTERGIRRQHGFLAEYYADTEDYLVLIPPALREVAVLLEPYSIIAKAMWQAWKIQERLVWQPQTALVTGAGTIGLLAGMALRARGLEVVICARSKPGTLNSLLAREMGATYVSLQETPLAEIPKLLGRRVDILFEATGHGPTALQCFDLVTTNGILLLNSVTSNQHTVSLDADALNFHLVMNNIVAVGIVNANRKYFEMGVRDFGEFDERFPGMLERIITRRVALTDFTVDLLKQRGGVKTTIEIHPDG